MQFFAGQLHFCNVATPTAYPDKTIDLPKTAFCHSKFQFLKLRSRNCKLAHHFCKMRSEHEAVIPYPTSYFAPCEAQLPTCSAKGQGKMSECITILRSLTSPFCCMITKNLNIKPIFPLLFNSTLAQVSFPTHTFPKG